MLDQSKAELDRASPVARRAAEVVARQYLAVALLENLVPEDEAERVADEHREQNDETWLRAVYGALKGLQAAEASGYRLEKQA